jgi:adenosylhomocysteine nucleosidase
MTRKNAYKIFIYTALPCEAKPLIEHFSLKKDAAVQSFAVYLNDEICLTVTGLGKIAMAAGVAYSQALFASVEHPVLLNIGIAGHKYHPLGVLYLIDKIIDVDSQRSYYPSLIFTPPCPSGSLQTLSKPRLNYDQAHLCDMEASAFYEAAMRFSSSELILCLKIISDNQISPAGNIQPKQVAGLIAAHLASVETLLARAVAKVELIRTPETGLFEQLIQRHHFSFNEKQQLKNQLSRWNLVTDHKPLVLDETLRQSGKDVLCWLDIKINKTGFYL